MWIVYGKCQNAGISLYRLFCNMPSSHWGKVYLCLYTTSVLDRDGWPTPCPDHFTPRKETQFPFTGVWIGPQASLDEPRKSRPPPGFKPWTIQSIASHYSNSAIMTNINLCANLNILLKFNPALHSPISLFYAYIQHYTTGQYFCTMSVEI
jgi:hypothetical protein